MSTITFYWSSVSANMEMKKQQQKIEMILESRKVDFVKVDITTNDEAKEKMRKLVGNPKALPPQLCIGDTYLGDYSAFEAAVEEKALDEFLKLK